MAVPWCFQTAGRLVLGSATLSRIGELLEQLDAKRPLVVSDPNLASPCEAVRRAAADRGIDCLIFDGGEPEPTLETVQRLRSTLEGERFDAVVGVGGGSNIDLAKAAALLFAHAGRIEDYAGQGRVPGPTLPVVAVPTTAGSGSEVSGACILGLPEHSSKLAVVDRHLHPALALVDPELHRSCPPAVTRDSGVDAFCHAVEAFTIRDCEGFPRDPQIPWPVYQGKHALSDALSERAVGIIAANLPRVMQKPRDLAAREQMALGALLAGMAMANTGIYTVHALTYPVGAFTHASHGACNGALLPAVLDFVAPARPAEMRRILELMGSRRESAGDAVRDWLRAVGAPASLAELGLAREQIESTAEIGYAIRRLMDGSPRPTSREELHEVVRRAWGETA